MIGIENVLGMVAGGYGVAILPEVLVSVNNPSYKSRPLRAPVPPFRLKLLWLRKAPSLVLQNFLALAEQMPVELVRQPSSRE